MQVWPLYAGLAIAACAASWRDFDLRPVGVALVGSFLASNAAQWLSVQERPAAYTVCEVMVLSMAFLAHVCGASRLTVGIVAVSIISISTNLYVTTIDHPLRSQVMLWELATNLCFGAECLLVVGIALHGRIRTRNRADNGRTGTSLHGRTTGAGR
jgi:hypothetical protein